MSKKNRTFAAAKVVNMKVTGPKIENPMLKMVGEEADRLGM